MTLNEKFHVGSNANTGRAHDIVGGTRDTLERMKRIGKHEKNE